MIYFFCLLLIGIMWLLPWWVLLPLNFIYGWFRRSFWKSIIETFIMISLLFWVTAFYYDSQSQGLASERLASMLKLPSPILGFVLTAVVGALPSALSAGLGCLVRSVYFDESKKLGGKL